MQGYHVARLAADLHELLTQLDLTEASIAHRLKGFTAAPLCLQGSVANNLCGWYWEGKLGMQAAAGATATLPVTVLNCHYFRLAHREPLVGMPLRKPGGFHFLAR